MTVIDLNPRYFSLTPAPGERWRLDIRARGLDAPIHCADRWLLEDVARALLPVLVDHDRRAAVAGRAR